MFSIKFTAHKVTFMNSIHEDLTRYASKCFISDGPVPKKTVFKKMQCILS